jgi:hypothetical protein
MPIREGMTIVDEPVPEGHEIPEVEVHGSEAVIRVEQEQGTEERRVKLPETIWA